MSRITEINKKAARRKLERFNWMKRKEWQRLRNPRPIEKEMRGATLGQVMPDGETNVR